MENDRKIQAKKKNPLQFIREFIVSGNFVSCCIKVCCDYITELLAGSNVIKVELGKPITLWYNLLW